MPISQVARREGQSVSCAGQFFKCKGLIDFSYFNTRTYCKTLLILFTLQFNDYADKICLPVTVLTLPVYFEKLNILSMPKSKKPKGFEVRKVLSLETVGRAAGKLVEFG